MMCPVAPETGLSALPLVLSVMEIIRYAIREVTCKGNLGVLVCTFGSPMIFPGLLQS